jgi:hypothetical protein
MPVFTAPSSSKRIPPLSFGMRCPQDSRSRFVKVEVIDYLVVPTLSSSAHMANCSYGGPYSVSLSSPEDALFGSGRCYSIVPLRLCSRGMHLC